MLLLIHLLLVELELLALKDVSVSATRLAGTRAEASQKTSTVELISNLLVENAVFLGMSKLGFDVRRSLGFSTHLV